MNPETHSTIAQTNRAFTLVELMVVLAVLALLAVMILPSMAGVHLKSGRMQCAANLRQIAMGSMMYANDYNTKLPTTTAGGNPVNRINGFYYTRFVWQGSLPNFHLPSSFSNLVFGSFTSAGLLYPGSYVGAGEALFCPSQWGSFQGASAYQPLLTSDSGGYVRSSYEHNPQVILPGSNNQRKYQKSTQLEPRRLFAADILDAPSNSNSAHVREGGWNVAFADCSVKFSQSQKAHSLRLSILSFAPYYSGFEDQLFEALEADH